MHPRGSSTALFLATIVLIVGLLMGCGGGDKSGSGSQQGGGAEQQGGASQKQGGAAKAKRGKNAPERKIALGTIGFINTETKRFTLHLSTDEQGEKPVIFKLAKKGNITLGGKVAEFGDMKTGQQAQVGYVVRNDSNRALSVRLFEGGGETSDDKGTQEDHGTPDDKGGEKTG